MDLELTGKVAIVTGASRGVGKAIAEELAREGVDVAICARSRDALEATAKTLADQLGGHGITVNLVHPGPTRTERTDAETERRASSNAIRRIVDAREIGLVVAFLASAKAAAVTGVAIDASGGSIPVMFQ